MGTEHVTVRLKRWKLRCDGCKEFYKWDDGTPQSFDTEYEVLDWAGNCDGWSVDGERKLCPDCAEKEEANGDS